MPKYIIVRTQLIQSECVVECDDDDDSISLAIESGEWDNHYIVSEEYDIEDYRRPDGWSLTEDKDISWEHCGQPAYWEHGEVFCSKCQIQLKDND